MALTLDWRLLGPGGLLDSSRKSIGEAQHAAAVISEQKYKAVIIGQVVEANTRIHSLSTQVATYKRALATAEEVFRLTRERKERGVGVVLENIFAEQEMTRARTDLLKAIAEFNKAQYALLRAVGSFEIAPAGKR